MKRRLFNLAAAVSLVLCVAIVWVWVLGSTRQPEHVNGMRELNLAYGYWLSEPSEFRSLGVATAVDRVEFFKLT